VLMGRVSAPFGVQGWLRVQPFTDRIDGLADYSEWWIGRGEDLKLFKVVEWSVHGRALLVHLQGCDDREAAVVFRGMDVAVDRATLPSAGAGQYYWHDLIGCQVVNLVGESLGSVVKILETGANAVLVTSGTREYLLPFVEAVVANVDIRERRIAVDWDVDF
jgi:16S rRNA processing protein RimM